MAVRDTLKARLDEQLRRASARSVESIAKRWGASFPMWIGCGYPKSGTVWLCKLLSSYLGVPYPQNYRAPIAMSSVIHAHWDYDPRFPPTAYIVRDGRDALVSMYFHQLRTMREGRNPRQVDRLRRRFEHAWGRDFDVTRVRENLPRFIELEVTRPSSGRRTWAEHVTDWALDDRPRVSVVTYEAMLRDPQQALGRLMADLTQQPPDLELVDLAVRRHEFSRISGRSPGTEDVTSFQRKGVSGDWTNYFSRAAGEVFDAAAGEALVALGYAESRRWHEALPR